MTAKLLDGKFLAQTLQGELALQAQQFQQERGLPPGLAAVLVGENPASQVYVRNKQKACEKSGFSSWLHQLPENSSQADLLGLISQLNHDPKVHGILVQLPLPKHLDTNLVLDAVAPGKDVDGFGPESLGLLASGRPRFLPCTPHGVLILLQRNYIPVAGKHVVVLGRSTIVGKPMGLILLQQGLDATVTTCHSRTENLASLTRQADILVAAIGKARFVTAGMVRPGAVVIDVGINRQEDGKLAGDVDFEEVKKVASAITPVPGGIGPMTIAMLLHNTLQAARLALSR
ncbi:MAG: bifunctional methylenetetrahydrofolate dehydrogenase/methenyltetrahydrofolate cyclohydrolase FolD [Gemmataceae bacterium]|nr:bifunctional methylenetetrahydrofolate dehydrogenase/methenyltetrahydrofolate cyclohydrolase FolD [Gemmataceae bacterium]